MRRSPHDPRPEHHPGDGQGRPGRLACCAAVHSAFAVRRPRRVGGPAGVIMHARAGPPRRADRRWRACWVRLGPPLVIRPSSTHHGQHGQGWPSELQVAFLAFRVARSPPPGELLRLVHRQTSVLIVGDGGRSTSPGHCGASSPVSSASSPARPSPMVFTRLVAQAGGQLPGAVRTLWSWCISSPGPGRPGQRPRPNRRVRPRPGSLPNRPVGRRVHPDRQVRAVVFAFQQDRLVEHRSPLRGPRLRTSRSLVDHRRHARTR
jgi:hypothetical protein